MTTITDATNTGLAPSWVRRFTCSICKAIPGEPCDVHRRGWEFHKGRTDKASREHMRLVTPAHHHAYVLLRSYAAKNGIDPERAALCGHPLRMALYSSAPEFLSGEKVTPPSFADARRIITDDMIAAAISGGAK